jgi:putative tricarboxylic transport membrane protein
MQHDLRAAIAVIAFSLLYLLGAGAIPQAGSAATVGPRAFPLGIGGLMLLSGLWLAADTLRKRRTGIELVALEAMDWRTWALVAGLLVAYAIVTPLTSFLLTTPLLMFGAAWAFGSRHFLRDAIVSVLMALAIYIVFNYGLNIRLT